MYDDLYRDHYRSQQNRMRIISGLVIAAVVALAVLCGINPAKAVFMRYEIQGEVLDAPKGKTFGDAESGITTKFSVRLQTEGGERIVNCTSTQCASLAPGDNVVLSCYVEWHLAEPNEEECRFDRLQ